MKLAILTGVMLITATNIYVSDCNSTNHNYDKSPVERRQILVKKIINKMTDLSLDSFNNVPPKDTPEILKNIRNQLKLAAKFTGPRGNRYVELLMDGIQSIAASKNKFGEIESVNTIDSNMQFPFKQEVTADYEEDSCDCSCVEERLCVNISSLDSFTCYKSRNVIPFEMVCDGKKDCVDESDEKQCRDHANKKLSDTKNILHEIKIVLPKHCLEVQNSVDKVVMKTRKQTLTKVLKKQKELLYSVAPIKVQKTKGKLVNKVKEIARIVSSVERALEGALCIREKYKTVISRRLGASLNDDLDSINNKKTWAPPLCTCKEQLCLQNNCTSACNNTCWQRYSLGRWVCRSITGARSLPIDVVCDGKFDCFDESDEKGCTAGAGADKFKATQIYNFLIDFLSGKMSSSPQLQKVINLQEAVKRIQVLSIEEETDTAAIKHWRNEAFSGLVSIYDGLLTMANNVLEVNAGYNSLRSVSRKLVEAMKHSKTGNDRLLPSNECHCMGDKCLLAKCTVQCVRFCSVKATVAEYSCKGNSSTKIPVQHICNGKRDCPAGDDELKCQTDVCRNHHLMVLRNKIKNYKDDRWGHALGEVLYNWKNKTVSSIRDIETTNRSTRQDLQQLVAAILQDLVQAYATLPKLTRRSTEGTMHAFRELSRLIQDTLRDCTI